MEQQLTARLGEGEITQFVQDNEVEAGEVVSNASLSAGSTFGLELIELRRPVQIVIVRGEATAALAEAGDALTAGARGTR